MEIMCLKPWLTVVKNGPRLSTVFLCVGVIAGIVISGTDAQQASRQNTVSSQYRLNNDTAGTKIAQTLLMSAPQDEGFWYRLGWFRDERSRGEHTRVARDQPNYRSPRAANSSKPASNADVSGRLAASGGLLAAGQQPPQFPDDTYRASVLENAAGGSLVLAVVAQDPDTDAIKYSIQAPGQTATSLQYQYFVINELTGVIRLVAADEIQFDQEQYRFTVVARDTTALQDTAQVIVNIIDVNDNRPEFPDCDTYSPEVQEEQPSGTFVLNVKAKDADKGENAALTYALVTSPNAQTSFFEIDASSGELTTSKKFNRDAPDHERALRVIVKANDRGTPSLESTCAFTVTVLDINDNAPLFDKKSYENSVAKDAKVGTPVERVSATDDDVGVNAAIMYSMEALFPTNALNYFQIDAHTGIISPSASLTDLKTDSEYRMRAIATDQSEDNQLKSDVPISITVRESRLQPPTFSEPPRPKYTLEENYRDTETPIATLRAVSNLPNSPKVYYELVHGAQEQTNKFRTFVVDENESGEAIIRYGGTKQLDYEQTPAYNITVVATTDQQTSAEVTFQIVLSDQNDEVPLFYDADQAVVPENSPPGTYVAVVSAVDSDATRPNNQVTYSLDKQSAEFQLFSIESGTGRISTRVPLDREDASRPSPFYTVTVFAEDGAPSDISAGGLPNKAKQRITVEVGDVNDNPPKFSTDSLTAHVKELVDVGSKVIDIQATDVDSDSKINYQITGGNLGAAFDIDQVTGTVTVKNGLDYEKTQRYNITVTASDGTYEDSMQVIIEVENQNDVAPVFDKPSYAKSMEEGYLSSTPILQVTATDPDPIGESSIIYKLSGPGIYEDHPENNVFSINEQGQVIVLKTLDRDEGTGGMEVWAISVQAWDDGGNGLFSSAPFQLTLSDINDNAPYLIQSSDLIPVIMENKKVDGISIPVEADDFDDHEKNGPPYSFAMDPAASADVREKFSVTTDVQAGTAVILPLMQFDREATKQYSIPIVVSDNPQAYPRPKTGTSLFTIIIGDENDNDMKPGSSVINVFNFEGKMPDTVVGRVYVDDPDDWDLPDKTFSWLEGDQRRFKLDSDTGDITMLRGTANGTYELKFSVFDAHWKSTVQAEVTVAVRMLPREAVEQSGSIRIGHMSAEQFVTPEDPNTPSRYNGLITELAQIIGIPEENVDVFGVQNNGAGGVDVRYAAHGSPYYQAQKLDGIVSENVRQLEEKLKIEILQVNIDECVSENTCDGNSCISSLQIFDNLVYTIRTNQTSVTGVKTMMRYQCGVCQAPPPSNPCMNGGTLVTDPEPRCECPPGYGGPNCEGLSIHFKGDGYAWFPHLASCNASRLSFDVTTSADRGLVLYNGPMSQPTGGVQDFFAVDVSNGRLRAFLNYGAGTFMASPKTEVDDSRRHHVDILWDAQTLTVLLDSCVGRAECQSSAAAPLSPVPAALLNVDAPLQLGGSAVPLSTVRQSMTWLQVPESDGFRGCLENVTFLGTAYDLSNPSWGEEYTNYCEEGVLPVPVIYADSSFLAALLTCLLFALLLVAVAMFIRQRNVKKYKSLKEHLVMDGVGRDDDGVSERDNTSFDHSTLRVEDRRLGEAVEVPQLSSNVVNGKQLPDEADGGAPGDDLRNYAYEGGSSTAGSLSTINSGTTDADMEFDYLLEMGPQFRRLADIYGVDGTETDSEGSSSGAGTHQLDAAPGESWC